MSLHQANKDKPRAQKCRHFCFSFDNHNYCPTCREAGKGDDPCVTFEAPCHIFTSLTDEQLQKIQNRKRYLKKQKAETSSKDELDLLGEGDGDSFAGSNADLENAADNLFTSPPLSSTSRLQLKSLPRLIPRLMLQKLVHPATLLLIWTYPLRGQVLMHSPRQWMWTLVQHSLLD